MNNRPRQGGFIIVLTLILALFLTAVPLPSWAALARPEWVPLVLIYWCLALPSRVNVGIAWILGLMVDVLLGTLLAQHALAYAAVAFLAVKLHKQIRVYPLWQQALSVFTLVALNQLLVAWVKGIIGGAPDSWTYWLPSVTSAILWPWMYLILRDIRRKFRVA